MLDLDAGIIPATVPPASHLGRRSLRSRPRCRRHLPPEPHSSLCIQAPTGTLRLQVTAVEVWATDGVIEQIGARTG